MSKLDKLILSDKLWGRRYSRWVALCCYIAGCIMIVAMTFFNSFWPVWILGSGGLLLWSVPVLWAAYKYSKQGFRL